MDKLPSLIMHPNVTLENINYWSLKSKVINTQIKSASSCWTMEKSYHKVLIAFTEKFSTI